MIPTQKLIAINHIVRSNVETTFDMSKTHNYLLISSNPVVACCLPDLDTADSDMRGGDSCEGNVGFFAFLEDLINLPNRANLHEHKKWKEPTSSRL